MINELFSALTNITGMEAVVIYNRSNKIIDSWTLPSFSTQILEELGINYQQIFEMLSPMPAEYHEMVLNFDKEQIFARYQAEFLLLSVSKKTADIPQIRLIVNIGFERYQNSKKNRKTFKLFSGNRNNFLKGNRIDSVESKYLEKMKSSYNEDGIVD